MKKPIVLFFLIVILFAFSSALNVSEAVYGGMPVSCKHPTASWYPAYYVYCKEGVQQAIQQPQQYTSMSYYYVSWLDEYRIDYSKINAAYYVLHYTSPINQQVHTKTYQSDPTGIHYLTCNGDYKLIFYNNSGDIIAETDVATTTGIQNPSCDSYADSGQSNDLNAKSSETPNGHHIFWDASAGAVTYEIWKDGQLVMVTSGTDGEIEGDGSVSVVAKDENGNIVGRDDLLVPITSDPLIDFSNGSCDVCQKIRDALACPDWDLYMGAWEEMIRRALPPPPDWPVIADIFAETIVDHMDEWMGNMPPTPSVSELENRITPNMPNLNTNVDGIDDLVPTLPSDFNDASISFDLSDAAEIEIIDESEPFIFTDPLSGINSSGVGVKVVPNDPNNHTDGIQLPMQPSEYDPIPTPNEINEAPAVEMPTPTPTQPSPGGGVIPNPTYSDMPIPNVLTNF